jgi:hypothetical protein
LPDLDQFVGVPNTTWSRLAHRLSEVGVFADEEGDFLSHQAAVSLLPKIEQKLRSLGYSGGKVEVGILDRSQEGASYVLFDNDRFSGPTVAQNAWLDDYQHRWRERVASRVANWLGRLRELRNKIQGWIAESDIDGLQIIDKPPALMHEELMRRFRVDAAKMPVYEISRDGRRLMRVQPKGLWVIGANGRVDLVTKAASLILVDASEPGSPAPDWEIYRSSQGQPRTPLNRDTFLDLLRNAA